VTAKPNGPAKRQKGRYTLGDLVKVGERITDEARFSKEEIAEFARLAGDFNPLHHDEEFAKATRFQGIIACGPQTASRFLGMTATHFSKRGASLGLEFTLRFLGPVRPGERLEMVWDVVDVTDKPKLNGEIVKMEGRVTNPAGEAVLTGTGTVLVARSL
jgi:acyl dehydratase